MAGIVGAMYALFFSIPEKSLWPISIVFTILAGIGLLGTGYINMYLAIYFRKKFSMRSDYLNVGRYFLSFLFSILFYVVVMPFFFWLAAVKLENLEGEVISGIIAHIAISNLLIFIIQNIIILQQDKGIAELELSRLQASHAEASNLLLRQQIHPHFLFNALSTLKALYKIEKDTGEKYLVLLSKFLRATLSNNNSGTATLDEELELYNNYLDMQKIRFGTALVCSTAIPEDIKAGYLLPSFSLQPLLENAIKHNEATEDSPLHVTLKKEGEFIVVSNNIRPKLNKEFSGGLGLANLSERYRLWCGEDIDILDDGSRFTVKLKLMPNEYSDYRR